MMTKRDLLKASLTTETASAHIGEKLVVVAVDTFRKADKETGEEREVVAIKTEDGKYITAISQTLIDAVDLLADLIADEEKVVLTIKENVSRGNRKFLTFDVE